MLPNLHPLFRLYHKSQKGNVDSTTLNEFETPDSWRETEYKEHRRSEPVPSEDLQLDEFEKALYKRESFGDSLSTDHRTYRELLKMLACAYGERKDGKRPVPSGGQRYPLELYVISKSVENIQRDIYHFNVQTHRLEQLPLSTMPEDLSEIWPNLPTEINAMVVITAVPDRSTKKYGEKGYLLTLLEAGCILQNIQLLGNHIGAGTRPYSNFRNRNLREMLKMQRKEIILTTVGVI